MYWYYFWLCSHVFFFFFKQKTAYELRISDWSSDVCSSDLRFHLHQNFGDQVRESLDRGRLAIVIFRRGHDDIQAKLLAEEGGQREAAPTPNRTYGYLEARYAVPGRLGSEQRMCRRYLGLVGQPALQDRTSVGKGKGV